MLITDQHQNQQRLLELMAPMPPIPIELAMDESDLLYRGEGNSSLVVALKSEHKVIRLLKADAKQLQNNDLVVSSASTTIQEDITAILGHCLAFNTELIPAVLSPTFVNRPQLVQLNRHQVDMINRLVQDKRPRFRLDKKIIDGQTLALLLPDYCCLPKKLRQFSRHGPVVSVEIKPKQGFLPAEDLLPPELKIKSQVCRYCLSQYHKMKKKSIAGLSGYCPLDLFSGCRRRMTRALVNLLDNPQNNLRIFRDIQLTFGEDNRPPLSTVLKDFIDPQEVNNNNDDNNDDGADDSFVVQLCNLLIQALLATPINSQKKNCGCGQKVLVVDADQCQRFVAINQNEDDGCQCNGHFLPTGCVLETILSAQRLDTIDSTLANRMFDQLCDIDGEDAVVKRLTETAVNDDSLVEVDRLANEAEEDYCLRKVRQFLVSLTAKDCSIMVTMQRTDDDLIASDASNIVKPMSIITDSATGHKYLVSVAITDLDPKSPSKLARTLSNDKRMAAAYFERFNDQS